MMMKKIIMQMRRSSRMVVSFWKNEPFYYVLSVDEDMGAAVLLLSDECTVRRPCPR